MKAFEESLGRGELAQAKELLNSNQQNLEPSAYFFHLGRVYALENQWAEARIAFLKSQNIIPRPETAENLKLIETKMAIKEVESPRTIKDYIINATYFTGTELALTLNLLLLVIGLWTYRRSRNFKKLMSILILMLILGSFSLWINSWPWKIAEDELNVYQGPSEIFDTVQVVPKGIKFLGVEKDKWINIIYPSRFEGWIKKEKISEL